MKKQIINTSGIKRKIRDRSGESLTETLVAVLISALAILMLAGAISAASRMITRARTSMETHYDAVESLISMTGSTSCSVTISSGGESETVGTNYKKSKTYGDKYIVAYRYKEKTE